jgi:hypothetical protein
MPTPLMPPPTMQTSQACTAWLAKSLRVGLGSMKFVFFRFRSSLFVFSRPSAKAQARIPAVTDVAEATSLPVESTPNRTP